MWGRVAKLVWTIIKWVIIDGIIQAIWGWVKKYI